MLDPLTVTMKLHISRLARDRYGLDMSRGEGLGLHPDTIHFYIFRDHISGLGHITSSQVYCDKGLYVELGALKYLVYLDFREVEDDQRNSYRRLAAQSGGRGVPSIEEAQCEMLRASEGREQPEPDHKGKAGKVFVRVRCTGQANPNCRGPA